MSTNMTSADDSARDLRTLLAYRLLEATGRTQSIPLSCAQQRLWFLDQLEPDSPLYNVPCVIELTGSLDLAALGQALDAVAARHETLRTRFVSRNAEPVQIIDDEAKIQIQFGDLTDIPEADRESEAKRRVLMDIKRPFNLSLDGLLRATVLRLAPDKHILVLNMHHIISDEWSIKVLLQELGDYYQGFLEGNLVSLPDLPIQYGDYSLWQRDWLKSDGFEEQLQYWENQLKGRPSAVELPTDRPRQQTRSLQGDVQIRHLGRGLGQALKELGNREGATMFMLLLAAFKVLLHRYTQQQDIIVGSPIVGRNRPETENLIGFFVNTLPLRTQISGDLKFQEFLAQVREVALGAYSNQDLPFEKLVEALHPERAAGDTPFISVMFLMQNHIDPVRMPGLEARFIDQTTGTAKFDLSLGAQETDEGLVVGMEYNTDLFDASTITRFLQHYESLLQGIVAEPTQRISELPLLSEAERCQLLTEWSPPIMDTAPGLCLHEWFEAQAERAPGACAVVCGNQTMSYRELNEQANQLARYLQRLGVGPEVPVALHLDRSLKLAIAIMGVLKAGGAYVPMDPAWPAERLSFMLQDTQAKVVLTLGTACGGLPSNDARIICLDSEWERIAAESKESPGPQAKADNAAYIIYTSGSTGRPKGVLVTHHNVVRLFKQTERWYGFNASDVWTLFHSYTFDFSVWEYWGALLYGGRLVIVPYLISRSPAEFYQLLSQEKVTVLNQTPSAFRQLLWAEATAREQLPLSLRYVIFGGEALELQSLKPWFDRHGDEKPQLVNMYGITETTVHVTYRVIRQADLCAGLGSVIGIPIPDLRVYLLDEKLQPVPAGVQGEICVAGPGVARGYLNRPELTSQRFIPDLISNQPGIRLYRSGDLARYTSRGELEYLGRMDHQVKIRGFRVELGEIESALNSHSAIRESVVVVAEDASGGKRLVAYVVPSGPPPDFEELRQYLARKIPDYMVPSAFLSLSALPLTSNGKVDRHALPSPDMDQIGSPRTCIAPRNPAEETLVQIWSQLLNRKTVSIHDNFFHLGGHSLLATQAVWRIAGAFNVDLPVRTLFEAPTIAMLAEAISKARPIGNASAISARKPDTMDHKMLDRLIQLSDTELEELLQSPKPEDVAS